MKDADIKSYVHRFFKGTEFIYSPAFRGERVYFNSKGISHIYYSGGKSVNRRSTKEIQTRVSLLENAREIIFNMEYFQDYRAKYANGSVNMYWGFYSIIERKKIKVVVRQIGIGNKHFYSVIPNW